MDSQDDKDIQDDYVQPSRQARLNALLDNDC